MIHNDADYRKAMAIIDEERKRIDGHVRLWKEQGMTDDEIKRLSDPMMCLHLQFVEEAEAWKMENHDPEMGVEECAGGFAVAEPQASGEIRFLYYGPTAVASQMSMLSSHELFPTRKAAEEHMLKMLPAEGCCMGPVRPERDDIIETTAGVLAVFRDKRLLTQDEESLCTPMAESRRRVLWLLEKAVEEVLFQDACESF